MPVKGKKHLVGREEVEEPKRDEEPEETEQMEIPGTVEKPETPKPVRGKFIMAKYNKPVYSCDAKDNRSLSLEFSFPLTKEHEALMPAEVKKWWNRLKGGGAKRIVDITVAPHRVKIYFAPDEKPEIEIDYAEIQSAALAVIEETGSGTASKVFRYSFRAVCIISGEHVDESNVNDLCKFADHQFNKTVWLKLNEVQPRLPLEEDEEDES